MTITDEALKNKLADLDKRISERKNAAQEARTLVMRDKLLRQVDFMNIHERKSIVDRHNAQLVKQAEQAAAIETRQREATDKVIAETKRSMRLKYVGTDAQFEQAWPSLLSTWQTETALGRMPAEQPTPDRNF